MSYKIVNAEQLDADLTSVADSIRAKAGKSGKLDFPSGFKSAIDSISKSEIKNQDITIKENGTFTADDGYTGFGTVKVETEVAKNQDITITENGTYTPASGFTGFGSVKVEVESSGSGGSLFTSTAVGIIPDIPKGFANSTFGLPEFESSAVGALA